MKESLRAVLVLAATTFSVGASAHKPGLYTIDNKQDIAVVFAVVEKCPTGKGALPGRLRTFTFSDQAQGSDYKFKSGFYVETHDEKGDEYYVRTDHNCIPTGDVRLGATKTTLSGFNISKK